MKIAITGASGFVGRALAKFLSSDESIEGLYLIGRSTSLSELELGTVIPADFSSPKSLLPELPPLDAVIHLATSPYHRDFPAKADDLFNVNVSGTNQILQAALRARAERFINISTGSVYEPFHTLPLQEEDDGRPTNYYAATKLCSEILTRAFSGHMQTTSLRLFVPYGPGQHGRMIPDLINRVSEGHAVLLPAQGTGLTTNPIFIDDVCHIVTSLLTQDVLPDTLNLAGPSNVSISEIARLIGEKLNKEPIFQRSPDLKAKDLIGDTTKLTALLPKNRLTPFSSGLDATLHAISHSRPTHG